MNKNEILHALGNVKKARKRKLAATRRFDSEVNRVMSRLLYEAAVNRMSVGEVAAASGYPPSQITAKRTALGIAGKRPGLLVDHAAEALRKNAEALGVGEGDIDLMSPLAYLEGGDALLRDTHGDRSVGEDLD